MRNISVAFALLLVLAPAARPQDEPKAFTVPFELLKTQHMVVAVKVNGKGPYRLIFDTGAPDSLVSNRIAREAELTPNKEFKHPTLPIFGARGQFRIKTLEMGDLRAENLSTMVLDHPTVTAISGVVGPIEGILGFTFFARYRLTIDYERKLLTFEPSSYQPPDVIQELMKRLLAPPQVRNAAPVVASGALLGVRVKKEPKDDEPGVAVDEVLPESAAAAAGLKSGDRLLTLDGRWTDSVTDLLIAASRLRPGTAVEALVTRQGKQLTLKLSARAGL
jgi:membrane-associated protease RseP (regulator of RpoE activity)